MPKTKYKVGIPKRVRKKIDGKWKTVQVTKLPNGNYKEEIIKTKKMIEYGKELSKEYESHDDINKENVAEGIASGVAQDLSKTKGKSGRSRYVSGATKGIKMIPYVDTGSKLVEAGTGVDVVEVSVESGPIGTITRKDISKKEKAKRLGALFLTPAGIGGSYYAYKDYKARKKVK